MVADNAETPSSFVVDEDGEHILRHRYGVTKKAQSDAALIALAHNLMPKLLAAVDLLDELNEYAKNSTLEEDDLPECCCLADELLNDFASRDSQSKGLPQRETVEAAGNPDSEHLDWLEAHPEFLLRKHKGRWFCTPFTNYPYDSYSTLREALRAAVEGTWNK